MSVRAELERIWNNPEVAFPCHIAGWVPVAKHPGKNKRWRTNTRFSNVLKAVRGQLVALKVKRRR